MSGDSGHLPGSHHGHGVMKPSGWPCEMAMAVGPDLEIIGQRGRQWCSEAPWHGFFRFWYVWAFVFCLCLHSGIRWEQWHCTAALFMSLY